MSKQATAAVETKPAVEAPSIPGLTVPDGTLAKIRELCQHVHRTDRNPTGPGGLAKAILDELGE